MCSQHFTSEGATNSSSSVFAGILSLWARQHRSLFPHFTPLVTDTTPAHREGEWFHPEGARWGAAVESDREPPQRQHKPTSLPAAYGQPFPTPRIMQLCTGRAGRKAHTRSLPRKKKSTPRCRQPRLRCWKAGVSSAQGLAHPCPCRVPGAASSRLIFGKASPTPHSGNSK